MKTIGLGNDMKEHIMSTTLDVWNKLAVEQIEKRKRAVSIRRRLRLERTDEVRNEAFIFYNQNPTFDESGKLRMRLMVHLSDLQVLLGLEVNRRMPVNLVRAIERRFMQSETSNSKKEAGSE